MLTGFFLWMCASGPKCSLIPRPTQIAFTSAAPTTPKPADTSHTQINNVQRPDFYVLEWDLITKQAYVRHFPASKASPRHAVRD